MTFEQITKIIELSFAFIGLVLVVFGWIVPVKEKAKEDILRRREAEERKKEAAIFTKLQWEKELVDRQISCFYGPLSELMREQNMLWKLIIYQLGKNHVFDAEKSTINDLPEEEQKIWIHFVHTYKIPLQKRMLEIIQSNQDLWYNSEIPDSYRLFLEYVLGFELLDNQKKNNVPNYFNYYYRFNYPTSFDAYVSETLDLLQKKQASLIKKL